MSENKVENLIVSQVNRGAKMYKIIGWGLIIMGIPLSFIVVGIPMVIIGVSLLWFARKAQRNAETSVKSGLDFAGALFGEIKKRSNGG